MKFRCNKAICHAVFLAPGPLPAGKRAPASVLPIHGSLDPAHEQPRASHQLAAIFGTLGWSPFYSEVPKEAGGRSHMRPREEISAGTEKRALEFLVPLPLLIGLKGAPHSGLVN